MSFQMSYYGIGWYVSGVLVLVAMVYIAQLKDKARLHRILNLALFLIGLTFVVPYCATYVFNGPGAIFANYLIGLMPLTGIVFAIFIYLYPRNLHRRESRIVPAMAALVFLSWCLYYYPPLFRSKPEFRMAAEFWSAQSVTRERLLVLYFQIEVQLLWGILLAGRKTLLLSRDMEKAISPWRALWLPAGEEARAMRNIGAALMVIALGITLYILTLGQWPGTVYRSLLVSFVPIICSFAMIQLYIVAIPERITFRAKMLGMSLILLLVFLGLGAVWVFTAEEKLYVERHTSAVRLAKNGLAAGQEPRLEDDMLYLAERTPAGWRVLTGAPGVVLPDILPMAGLEQGRHAYTPQAVRLYRRIAGRVFIIRDFKLADRRFHAGFDYRVFRAYMHRGTLGAMQVIGTALLLLIIVFPLMLRSGLTAPLDRLLSAVGQVSRGDYSIQLPVRGLDSIGELSTAFNQMSRVIRENTAELENQVRERTAGLEVSNRKLAEMDRLKTNFFTNLSHELRTPLTLLLAPLERITEGRGGELGPAAAAGMHRNALRLLNLVNNLLNLSRLDAEGDELLLRSGDIAAYAKDLARGFETAAAARGLYLRVSAEPESIMANFDAGRVETILLNLLSNAVKFTRTGGVEVRVRGRNAGVEIAVADTGPGIPESARELIFDRYGRFEGDSKHYGGNVPGSGIGLALAGELAHSHGGRIRLESEPGRGAVFTLELPGIAGREDAVRETSAQTSARTGGREDAAADPAGMSPESRELMLAQLKVEALAASEARPAPAMAEDGPLVLVVEDHDDMRNYLADILNEEYRVVTAADGREGLEAARREMPALIVSDVMMPDMNGLELLAALREDEKLRPVPFILLTAKAAVADRLAGLDLEADDYITKPFHTEEFLLRARNLLNRTGMLDILIEKNRLEIYGDLHDHLGARLTDLAILTDKLLSRTREGGPPAEHEQLLDSLERNIALIRAGFKAWLLEVEDLRLLRDDFLDGLQLSLIRRYSGSDRLIRFQASDDLRDRLASPELDPLKSILFAAAREITTNDLKYGTGAAEWTLTRDGGTVLLSVVTGSKYSQGSGAGLGIAGIRRRVEEPGGSLRERLENGTYSLIIEIPLPATPALN